MICRYLYALALEITTANGRATDQADIRQLAIYSCSLCDAQLAAWCDDLVAMNSGARTSRFIHPRTVQRMECGDVRIGWLFVDPILRVRPLSIRTGPRRPVPGISVVNMFDLTFLGTSAS